LKVDLHCHSHFSDGKHSPDYLVSRAERNQLTHLAITDHDYLAPTHTGDDTKVKLISGVEISCLWERVEIHVVGLLVDPADQLLQQLLLSQQQKRKQRTADIDKLLNKQAVNGLMQYLEELHCISYTRSHVADFLVESGLCKDRKRAFRTHLGHGGKLYIEADWCSLPAAVNVINKAGGIAVLAHPSRYPLGKNKLARLITDFSGCGGEGLETCYGSSDKPTMDKLSTLCLSFELWASMGSDFHDSKAHWTDIGRFPALPEALSKSAIWLHPRWQI
jgi:predicted metal-dependent phosphoesterase TrpH